MLEAKEVNFAYRRGLPVLNDIACTIGDGEFVALLGHNGSGKTTLSRLFMALLHPRSGQVLVDGVDVRDLDPHELREAVATVPQKAFLFSGTIASTLRHGRQDADDAGDRRDHG